MTIVTKPRHAFGNFSLDFGRSYMLLSAGFSLVITFLHVLFLSAIFVRCTGHFYFRGVEN